MYEHGSQACGSALRLKSQRYPMPGRPDTFVSWYECWNRECDFREFVPRRRTRPVLQFELVCEEAFKVTLGSAGCLSPAKPIVLSTGAFAGIAGAGPVAGACLCAMCERWTLIFLLRNYCPQDDSIRALIFFPHALDARFTATRAVEVDLLKVDLLPPDCSHPRR